MYRNRHILMEPTDFIQSITRYTRLLPGIRHKKDTEVYGLFWASKNQLIFTIKILRENALPVIRFFFQIGWLLTLSYNTRHLVITLIKRVTFQHFH